MRCGRIRCVAGQGSVGMRRLPLCERQSGAGGGWPPWVSFLTSLPGRLRNPQPALDFLKEPQNSGESVSGCWRPSLQRGENLIHRPQLLGLLQENEIPGRGPTGASGK